MNSKKRRVTRKRCVRKCKKRTSRKLRGSRRYGGGRTPASESERSMNSVRSTISKRRPDSATTDWIKNLEREQVLRRVAEEERKERALTGPHWGVWTPNYSWETKPPTTSSNPERPPPSSRRTRGAPPAALLMPPREMIRPHNNNYPQ